MSEELDHETIHVNFCGRRYEFGLWTQRSSHTGSAGRELRATNRRKLPAPVFRPSGLRPSRRMPLLWRLQLGSRRLSGHHQGFQLQDIWQQFGLYPGLRHCRDLLLLIGAVRVRHRLERLMQPRSFPILLFYRKTRRLKTFAFIWMPGLWSGS